MVVYSNSNIDVITDAGDVHNLQQIKSLVTTYSKKVNDINFDSEGNIYAATDFGYVVFDHETMEGNESRFFHNTEAGAQSEVVSLKSVAIVGNNILGLL